MLHRLEPSGLDTQYGQLAQLVKPHHGSRTEMANNNVKLVELQKPLYALGTRMQALREAEARWKLGDIASLNEFLELVANSITAMLEALQRSKLYIDWPRDKTKLFSSRVFVAQFDLPHMYIAKLGVSNDATKSSKPLPHRVEARL
ncbi:hypothetical protein QAD02_000366 [Eretmocerus hayati]|uniref:Uncharacterized protein n=1 Tax=Eretmocerus hayati TaxID=131215 RepID=A0ACC2ND96_9HYME|nr:hypothetical protein QAD02_000366 [Eretmocerus hayati]